MNRVVILDSARAAATAVADLLARSIAETPGIVLGLPTGRTPIPMYKALVDLHERGKADFARVQTFNLDEFSGLEPDDPRSYRAFMRRHLFDRVNVTPERVHLPDGSDRNWRRAADRYEQALAAAGGLDCCVLGIGDNGHIGFNEPGGALTARTHRVKLRAGTRRANAHLFGGRWQDVPAHALSMGVGTILTARLIVLLATGRPKAAIVARALRGPVTTRLPASLLQVHPNVVVVLDRPAASALPASAARLARRLRGPRRRA